MLNETTLLLTWLRVATPSERTKLAALADTSVPYLYQLATCKRGATRLSAVLAIAIEDGTKALKLENDALPVITVRSLATMCSLV